METEAQLLATLEESIQLLAAEYEAQVSALPSFVAVADELAQTYDDAFASIDQIADAGLVSDRQLLTLREIDQMPAAMSANADQSIWTLEALKHAETWEQVRVRAREALHQLGKEPRRPLLLSVVSVDTDGSDEC